MQADRTGRFAPASSPLFKLGLGYANFDFNPLFVSNARGCSSITQSNHAQAYGTAVRSETILKVCEILNASKLKYCLSKTLARSLDSNL